jgi:hypothetical protein
MSISTFIAWARIRPSIILGFYRQSHRERASLSRLALDLDPPPMLLNNPQADG